MHCHIINVSAVALIHLVQEAITCAAEVLLLIADKVLSTRYDILGLNPGN